jgi:hypothetical protein
MMLGMMMALC